jgi:hypothetical protein
MTTPRPPSPGALTAAQIAAVQFRCDERVRLRRGNQAGARTREETLCYEIAELAPELLANYAALRDRLARAEVWEQALAERSKGLEHALVWALPMLKLWYPGNLPPYVAAALAAPTDGAVGDGDATGGETQ